MAYDETLASLENAISDMRNGRIAATAFCGAWRAQTDMLDALPVRYHTVMEDLLGRLEAGSLFTEESCSFSQADLLASLDTWIAKARQALDSPP